MGRKRTLNSIKKIHNDLASHIGLNSQQLTARAIRHILEDEHKQPRDAYKTVRKLLGEMIDQVHAEAQNKHARSQVYT